jgi:S-adenosylmethionine-diacylglycerol 3-amino-3-carboxypropyl transferase
MIRMGIVGAARERFRSRFFRAVHHRNLIYNTCWEDPALDRQALGLEPADRVLVITSAGCNALDYLLAGAGEVNAVDVNPIQNALLELKVAGLKKLDYSSFFALFGRGHFRAARQAYFDVLRDELSSAARRYWDRHLVFFQGRGWRKSFYYRGTTGWLAKLIVLHAQRLHGLGRAIDDLLAAGTVEGQREVYERFIRDRLWTPWLRWLLARSTVLSLVGVPWHQRNQIVTQYPGAVAQFIRDCVEAVFTRLPLRDNYFWRVYLQGHYTPDCCPEYLKPANFAVLKNGLLDRLRITTAPLAEFLRRTEPGISKFVLLDHMDWLSSNGPALREEWELILCQARPTARAIFRSAGLKVGYLDRLRVCYGGRESDLGGLLRYHPERAAELHARDRVHTYGSFYIADLPSGGGT